MIIIHPYPSKLKTSMDNAKMYPYWKELIPLLDDKVIQIGVDDEEQIVEDFRVNLSLKELTKLLTECKYWISVDSFLPHLAHHIPKPGVVIWSVSDPKIFGYEENLNLLKDRKYLRSNQFGTWEEQSVIKDSFLSPIEINEMIKSKFRLVTGYINYDIKSINIR